MSSNPYRKDFPLLENNKVIYLDNAATSQRPEAVIQAEAQFYEKYNANPLRGLYELSVEATDCYEEARETVRKFIGAGSTEEIIFTRNTTEGLNLVAYSYGFSHLKAGDEVLVALWSITAISFHGRWYAVRPVQRLNFWNVTRPDF